MDGGCTADRRRMRDGCAPAARRRRDGSATDARWTDDQCVRRTCRLASERRLSGGHIRRRIRRLSAAHFGRMTDGRRHKRGEHKPYFGLMTAVSAAAQRTDRRRSVRRMRDRRDDQSASVGRLVSLSSSRALSCPSRARRPVVVHPSSWLRPPVATALFPCRQLPKAMASAFCLVTNTYL